MTLMNNNCIISRNENIKTFILRNELKPLKFIAMEEIPKEILDYTGRIISIEYPQQGMCSLIGILKSDKRNYVLKIAKGEYRGKELYAEYLIMKNLNNTSIPVPEVYMFSKEGDMTYILREYSEGIPLSTLFNESMDEKERMAMIKEIAFSLSKIHNMDFKGYTWENFIDAQLYFAEQHMRNNTLDLTEFVFNGKEISPDVLLQWLKSNKPEPGKVCLIHGDYRPKNFLWTNNRISSILDWAFCDVGDPYYDFTIFMYYLRNNQEKQHFLDSYGLDTLDEERLKYFEYMAPFINI